LHPVIQQFQLLRRAGKEEEPVVGKGRRVELKGGRRTAVSRLQADPPQLITRRGRLVREDLEPVQGPDQIAAPGPFLSHGLPPPQQVRPISPPLDYSTPASAAHATSPSANAVATRRKDALGVEHPLDGGAELGKRLQLRHLLFTRAAPIRFLRTSGTVP